MPRGELVGEVVGGKFRVERALGHGGMGSVFLAVQEPLGRKVALKVVRGADARRDTGERFVREARVVAQLNCPHCVTLYDFGDHEGEPYIAMELLEGETLRSRLDRGPIAPAEALSYARDLACALRSAHEAGIVHRDVKPDNVMLVRDRDRGTSAKLLDFGIAKLRARDERSGTQMGAVVGTPGYIAPETINLGRGDDPSVDVYAVGVILYEMLCGAPPFTAEAPLGLLVAHAQMPVPDVVGRGMGVPPQVAELAERLLAKDPRERPADGAELVAAIDVVRASSGLVTTGPITTGSGVRLARPDITLESTLDPIPIPERPSIAVQPFHALGGEDERLFAEGISEDVLSALSCFKQLFVVAMTSMIQPQGRDTDALRVGRLLGVRYVLQGSVRRGGDRVRIAAKLTDATTGSQVWAQRYDRELSDLFAVQDEVTRAIVACVAGRVEEADAEIAKKKAPQNLAAYDWLARGRALHHRRTRADNEKAREALDKAVELDPDYAQGHAWRACVWGQAMVMGADVSSAWPQVRGSVEKALELGESDAECQRLACELAMGSDLQKAWAHHLKAIALNPNDARIVAQHGEVSMYRGELDAAVESLEQAVRLDPLAPGPFLRLLSFALYVRRDLEQAAAVLERLDDARPEMLALRAAVATLRGRVDEASRWIERAKNAAGGTLPPIPQKPFATSELAARWREGFERAGMT